MTDQQAEMRYPCLLLDFGGVCIKNPVELHHRAEQELGLEAGALTWLGPIDPSTDELWRRMVAGDGVTEREYWTIRATEVGEMAGRKMSRDEYMTMLYWPPDDSLIRPECAATVDQAFSAGLSVSVLTNDLRAFHGEEWERGIGLLQRVDQLVDCSNTGVLKPDPRAFERAVEMTGFSPSEMLFVDDQPLNVEGAEAFGIDSLWFDIANPQRAWAEVGERLGL